jgi:lactate dehydrogenase-like 2-hydroxyacid dehydrogenase
MRIVVLDDFDLGSENLERLARHGEVSVYTDVPADDDELVARAADAEVVLTCWTRLDRPALERLPRLRMVSLAATGTDTVDVATAARRGVVVCRVPAYATEAVAELAVGLMLAVARKLPAAERAFRERRAHVWRPFCGGELCGRTLGVVGTGAIGRRVARIAHAFGMTILAYDLVRSQELVDEVGATYLPLNRLFADSDVVTLHAPQTPQTEGMVDGPLLALMSPHAVLVNTARAGLVHQTDLYEALRSGAIAGAGLDVLDLSDPSAAGFFDLDSVVLTPHIGFNTAEASANLATICTDNAVRFLEGKACNVAVPPGPAAPLAPPATS